MREDEAKRSPQALDDEALKGPKTEGVNPRAGATKEAVQKDKQSMDAVMNDKIPPDPGIQEDYGAASGSVPSQEPGNPKKDQDPRPT